MSRRLLYTWVWSLRSRFRSHGLALDHIQLAYTRIAFQLLPRWPDTSRSQFWHFPSTLLVHSPCHSILLQTCFTQPNCPRRHPSKAASALPHSTGSLGWGQHPPKPTIAHTIPGRQPQPGPAPLQSDSCPVVVGSRPFPPACLQQLWPGLSAQYAGS